MQKHSFHQEGSDLGGSPEGREINPSGQTPMGTPVLSQQMEADHRDQTIQSFAQNILRLGNECRSLNVENAKLKYEAVHNFGQLGEQSAEIARLKAEVERLTNCKAEADRLKAEVERLNNLIISGGAVTADPEIYP